MKATRAKTGGKNSKATAAHTYPAAISPFPCACFAARGALPPAGKFISPLSECCGTPHWVQITAFRLIRAPHSRQNAPPSVPAPLLAVAWGKTGPIAALNSGTSETDTQLSNPSRHTRSCAANVPALIIATIFVEDVGPFCSSPDV